MISEEFFKDLMNEIPAGIYVLDKQGCYIYANDAYINLLGVPREDLIMQNVHDLQRDGHYDNCISDYVFRERQKVSVFLNVFIDNGSTMRKRRQLVRAIPIFDDNGEISYMIGLCDSVDYLNNCYSEANTRSLASQYTSFSQPVQEENTASTEIIAVSGTMKQVMADAKNMAQVDSNILISGASGTGKERMAEYIHRNSPRSKKRMVVVNCASIPENLLESSLYGYERGAFTGALSSGKMGLIEAANGGTLFLDEINSLPLELQGKLLRTLENKKVQRVGSIKEFDVDFRLIAATNSDLQEMIRTGLFRADLYYRLNILPINLPSLKDRREDIIPLTHYYCNLFCEKYKKDLLLNETALQRLTQYDWPGNVRELRNIIERTVVMCKQEYVTGADIERLLGSTASNLPEPMMGGEKNSSDPIIYETMLQNHVSLQNYIENCEKNYLQYALEKFTSSYKTAKALQTTQSLVIRRKEKYRL